MWPFRKTRIFTSSSLRAMGLPNSKEFQEAFYLKEKKLQSHLDQRRKLFEAIESSVNENPNNLEEVLGKVRQTQTEILFFEIMLKEIDIGPLTLGTLEDWITSRPNSIITFVDPITPSIELTEKQYEHMMEEWKLNLTSKSEADNHESSDTGV